MLAARVAKVTAPVSVACEDRRGQVHQATGLSLDHYLRRALADAKHLHIHNFLFTLAPSLPLKLFILKSRNRHQILKQEVKQNQSIELQVAIV